MLESNHLPHNLKQDFGTDSITPLARSTDLISSINMEDELRSEYDFAQMKGGVRGKHVERYRTGTNLVLLAPDVARAFPLRLLIQVAQR